MESGDIHMASETSEPNKFQEKLKKKLMVSTVLDCFTKLTSEAEKLRVSAGLNLLKHLNSVDSTDKKESELTYTLDRLVRGVGSTKSSAKTGFYSVLVALLTKTTLITTEDVLNAVTKHLSTAGSNSKGENADICMGQILVCGALIHSGMFLTATKDEQLKIVEILITAGKKKSYLSLATYTFLSELIEKLDENQFKPIWKSIKEEVLKPWKDQTLDTVYLLLLCKGKFPTILKKKSISGLLQVPEIVHEQSITHLCEILLNIPMLSSLKHPIYEMIAKKICENEGNLIKPWCLEMDNQLQRLNRNKHIIIATMLTSFLENSTGSDIIPHLLTVNFISSTIQIFRHYRVKDKDDEFYFKMDKFFKTLSEKLQSKEIPAKDKISVLNKLLFYPGIFIFEKVTRTKIVQQITASLNAEGVKSLAALYCDVATAQKQKVAGNNQTENWINADRVYATQLVVKLMGHSSVQKENEWRLDQLKFLLKLGLFKEDDISVGTELAVTIKDSFYHALDQRLPKLEDLRNILSSIVHYINENVFESSTIELRNNLSDDGLKCWSEMIQLVKKLESKNKFKHNYAIPVFHTLLLHMGLQLFSDFEMAQNSLKELHSCFARLESTETPKKQRNMVEGTLEEYEPVWIEVVVDLFLSLLSHNSHLLRSIIGCVFPYLCPHLTVTAIRQILDVLDPKNEDNPLLKNNEEDDEDSDVDSNDEKDEESNSEESESDVDDIESDLEENGQQETATDKLRLAVREALHKSGYQTDDESEDMDNMDEEEGKKLDKALAEAFKLAKKNNKGKKNNKQTKDDKALTHFRVRVLDLIEIYLDSEPSMLQCLEIACLLLQTLEFSIRDAHQKPLEFRVRSCLKKLTGLKKFNTNLDVTEDILSNMLTSFLDKGSRSAFIYQDMGDIIAECCMFIIRCSQMLKPLTTSPNKSKKHSKIEDIFKESLETFFIKRDCLLPLPLFKNALQLVWNGNWLLVPLLIEYAFKNDIRPFRRGQALELLIIFYTNARFRNANIEKFKKRIGPLEIILSKQSISLFQQLATNVQESKIREKFVYHLLTLLSAVKSANTGDNMNWEVIGKSVREYRSHVTLAKDAKLAYNKLCRILGISNMVKMQLKQQSVKAKNKANNLSEESKNNNNATITNKRKNNKNQNKQKKKEARLLRLKASSEGLSNEFAFSNVALSDIKLCGEVSEEDSPKEKNIKKNKQNVSQNSNQANSSEDEIVQNEQPKKKKLKKIKKQNNIQTQILNGNSPVANEAKTNNKVKKNEKKRNHSESDSPNKKKTKI